MARAKAVETPKTKKSAKTPAAKPEKAMAKVRGQVVIRPLASVGPNPWNPNVMTAFERESLKVGFTTDGWIASQALLIWGTDDKGKRRDLIIDGEHRHTIGVELGIVEGPMVFLDKLPESQAKALTVKMNAKRGTFDTDDLGKLLREIQFDLGAENLSLDLGIDDEALMKLLAEPQVPDGPGKPGSTPGDMPSGMASHVRMVQLFFDEKQHEEFARITKELAARWSKENTTDTVLEAVRRAGAAAK